MAEPDREDGELRGANEILKAENANMSQHATGAGMSRHRRSKTAKHTKYGPMQRGANPRGAAPSGRRCTRRASAAGRSSITCLLILPSTCWTGQPVGSEPRFPRQCCGRGNWFSA